MGYTYLIGWTSLNKWYYGVQYYEKRVAKWKATRGLRKAMA